MRVRKTARAPKLSAEERRHQILEAAIPIFARKGHAAAGTAEIAEAAGIGEPTIYRYFPNKMELYFATVRLCADEIMEAWRRIAEEEPDPLNALLRLGQWYHQSMRERPDVLRLRFRAFMDAADSGMLEWARETQGRFREFVYMLFERARESGRLNPATDTRTMTLLFMSVGALLDQMNLLENSEEIQPRDLVALGNVLFEGKL